MAVKKGKLEALEHLIQKSLVISKGLAELFKELQAIAEEEKKTETVKLKGEPAQVFHEPNLSMLYTPQADRLIRLKEVLEILPISKSTFWSGVKNGRYPKPTYSLGPKTPTWVLSSILHLVNAEYQVPQSAVTNGLMLLVNMED